MTPDLPELRQLARRAAELGQARQVELLFFFFGGLVFCWVRVYCICFLFCFLFLVVLSGKKDTEIGFLIGVCFFLNMFRFIFSCFFVVVYLLGVVLDVHVASVLGSLMGGDRS